jgi:hypothetical protein
MALQPVPITATRLPVTSTSWRQRAVWNAGPAKLSSPGSGGTVGTDSCPQAVRSTFAKCVPPLVSSSQPSRASSQRAPCTSVRVRIRSRTP